MSSIYDWSLDPNKNGNSDSAINWQEGQPPSSVNNSARAIMQRIAEYLKDNLGDITQGGNANNLLIQTNAASNLINGLRLNFFAKQTNTEAVTIDYNRHGAKPVFKHTEAGIVPLQAGDMRQYGYYNLVYNAALGKAKDGWLLLNPETIFQSSSPPGSIMAYGAQDAPMGWLACDGKAVSRTEYSRLFNVIGEKWGKGDGKATFNIPDLRGYFLRGWGHGTLIDEETNRAFASTQQSANLKHTHTGMTSEAGEHTHNFDTADDGVHNDIAWRPLLRWDGPYADPAHYSKFIIPAGNHTHQLTIEEQGGKESRPINKAVLYIIKV